MMSRRKTLPSLSSSRQMIMAWKVRGLSQRPAIMVSRPASIRLAIAISPSRERSSTEAIFAEVHAHRVVSSFDGFFGLGFGWNRPLLDFDQLVLAFRFLF